MTIAAISAFFFTFMGTISGVYRVSVGLTPMQLVLVGTALELSVFIFEIPTGIVADLRSRRLSIIIGYAVWGLGFILEGSFPYFGTILLAQVVWGLGYTFTSGAQDAWLADEIGEENLTLTYLRATQISQIASLLAIGLSVYIATFSRGLPLIIGGVGLAGLSIFLLVFMPETHFRPMARAERDTWRKMWGTFKDGYDVVRGAPILLIIFTIEVFIGLHSEGIDRFWEAHLLRNFTLPSFGDGWNSVYWFGIISVVTMIGTLIMTEFFKRRLKVDHENNALNAMMAFTTLTIAGILLFALTSNVTVALGAFMALAVFRSTIGPIQAAWINKKVPSEVKATVLSMLGQTNAVGQIISGPLMGIVATVWSIRAAFVAVAALLAPIVPLYVRAKRQQASDLRQQ